MNLQRDQGGGSAARRGPASASACRPPETVRALRGVAIHGCAGGKRRLAVMEVRCVWRPGAGSRAGVGVVAGAGRNDSSEGGAECLKNRCWFKEVVHQFAAEMSRQKHPAMIIPLGLLDFTQLRVMH